MLNIVLIVSIVSCVLSVTNLILTFLNNSKKALPDYDNQDNVISFDGNPVFDSIVKFCEENKIELFVEKINDKTYFSPIRSDGEKFDCLFSIEDTKNIEKKDQEAYIENIKKTLMKEKENA